jgi:hypothetical protein
VAQRTAAKSKSTETPAATPKATSAKKTVVSTPAPTPAPAAAPARPSHKQALARVTDRRPPAQHGTVRMANEGCDCDLCRTALSDYRRERATADW